MRAGNGEGRTGNVLRCLFPVLCSPFPALLLAQAPAPISDNSFLIEEAYNQEPGVVQHISTFSRPNGGGAWAYSFTQEWPLFGELYQLSYTVPVLHEDGTGTGLGDVGLNFRYQLLGGGDAAVHSRLGSRSSCQPAARRAGGERERPQYQTNLPLSWVPAPRLATHWNAGMTVTPGRRGRAPFLGASAVWLLRPEFNLLVEALWTGGDDESRPCSIPAPGGRSTSTVGCRSFPGWRTPSA